MTDKQIMINGVDVSKCMFFNKNYKEDDVQIKNFCELHYISCKEFDCANCYFKKWKRKEQECEELKGRLKYIINENKVLKDCTTDEDIDIVALKNYISTLEFSNDQLKDVIKKYEECNKFLVEENGKTYTRLEYKLLRILIEIKDIAEENIRIADLEGLNGVYRRGLAEQILQKISGCEI